MQVLQTLQKLLVSPTNFVKLFAASVNFLKVFCKSHKLGKVVCKFYELHKVVGKFCKSDSGEKSPRRFFRWFWNFLKEEKVFIPVFLRESFILNYFSKCNLHFQSVQICWVLIPENITKMSCTQQCFTEIQLFKVEYF